jgi:hypothetical protein
VRTILLTYFRLEIRDRRAEAIEPGLFEVVEPSPLECQLLAAHASLELGSAALCFGQGKLALALVVTLEDGEQISRLHVLSLGDEHLLHAHARSGPDHDRPRLRLQMGQCTDVRAGDRARSPARRLCLRRPTRQRPRHRERQGNRPPSADHQSHGCRLPVQYPGLRRCAPFPSIIFVI